MDTDALSTTQISSNSLKSFEEKSPETNALPELLQFQIIPSTDAMLPLTKFAEILKVPISQVVPIPHMPAYVMGVYNWRGTVLWILDLGLLLGMMPCHKYQGARSAHSALVIERKDESSTLQQLGLVIHEVVDTVQIDPSTLKALELSNLPKSFTQFLSGYWMNDKGEVLAVLDDKAILDYMPSDM
ncbi:MAG: CheW domain-containing protein [Cyanobacteria bacterium P01_F01_bin.150]